MNLLVAADPKALDLKGVVLIDRGRYPGSVFALDFGTSTETQFSPDNTDFAGTSPDRTRVAFQDLDKKWLVVAKVDGQVAKALLWRDNWGVIVRWLDDQHVLIHRTDLSTAVIDVATGREESFRPENFPEPNPLIHQIPMLAPGLKQAVYVDAKGNYALLDIGANTVLARLPVREWGDRSEINSIAWTKDGTRVFLVSANEIGEHQLTDDIFSIDNTGTISKLTSFLSDKSSSHFVVGISLSPDERRLAFWDRVVPAGASIGSSVPPFRLGILDLATHDTVFYCDVSLPGESFEHQLGAPIWSPDGRSVMFEARDSTGKSRVLVLDTIDRRLAQIAADAFPLGWMLSETR